MPDAAWNRSSLPYASSALMPAGMENVYRSSAPLVSMPSVFGVRPSADTAPACAHASSSASPVAARIISWLAQSPRRSDSPVPAHAMTWPASSHCHSILVAPAMERMRASARRTSAGVTPPLSCTGMRHSAQSPRRWQAVASPTNAGVFRHVLSAFDMTIAASMPDARSVPCWRRA